MAGAHLRGQPWNRGLRDLGARFVRACRTAGRYRFVGLLELTPPRPGLIRDDARAGSIAVEVYDLTYAGFGKLVVGYFLRRSNRELGREVREVSEEAMAALRAYPWPGNLRELQSVLKQALLRATGSVLLPAMLPDLTAAPAPAAGAETPTGRTGLEEFIRKRLADGPENLHDEAHRELDRVLLPLVMEHTRGNQFQAAKVLGVARRSLVFF